MDLILSSTYGLPASALTPFCESLISSGYCGRRIMVTYDRDQERDAYLAACGFQICPLDFPDHLHPFLHRFFAYQALLRELPDVTHALACDSRDLVFQRNPSAFLADRDGIILADEGVRIRDEPWITDFLQRNFPDDLADIQDKTSVCAGTIAGTREHLIPLCGLIARVAASGLQHRTHPCDQPALNLIAPALAHTSRASSFACTAGTLLDPKFDRTRTLSRPEIVNAKVYPADDALPYLLLHQYDRIPELRDSVPAHYVRPVRNEPEKNGQYQVIPPLYLEAWQIADPQITGRTVALVAPSPSLQDAGDEIDSADVIVRMNRALLGDGPSPDHHGTRTDILYHCLHQGEECGGPIPYQTLSDQGVLFASAYPRGLHPFHQDASRFLRDNTAWHLPHRFFDRDLYLTIARATGTRPNTGILAIVDLLRRSPRELRLYGFTFFRDGHHPAYKQLPDGTLDQWLDSDFNGNHHQLPQIRLLADLCDRFPCIVPDAPLQSILDEATCKST